MKCINTVDAAGHVLCHDITRIVKDVVKDAVFRKGHVIAEEDIPMLLSVGKEEPCLGVSSWLSYILGSHCQVEPLPHL